MRRVVVYNVAFFKLSETFIYRQIKGISGQFLVSLLGFTFQNEKFFKISMAEKLKIPPISLLDKIITRLFRKVLKRKSKFSFFNTLFINSVLRRKDVCVIHAHYGGNGIRIMNLAKRNRIPLIVSFHGKDASATLKKESYKKQLPVLFDYASAIIVSSPHMIETLNLGNVIDKVHIIPYGVDTVDFQPEIVPRLMKDGISILHAGRIVPKKGVPDVITVFAALKTKYPDLQLHILGDGQERKHCEVLVSKNNLGGSVFFYGAQPQPIVKDLMRACDIFVLNSRTDDSGDMEGLPNTILEAMSLEKAVVATYHAGIPQAIRSGINGLLVPERDNAQLTIAFEKLITDAPLRELLGKNARQTILQDFTIEKMQERLCDVLSAVDMPIKKVTEVH
jgi:colanic acid/amylovoran biosynthesis glycosyltransferase